MNTHTPIHAYIYIYIHTYVYTCVNLEEEMTPSPPINCKCWSRISHESTRTVTSVGFMQMSSDSSVRQLPYAPLFHLYAKNVCYLVTRGCAGTHHFIIEQNTVCISFACLSCCCTIKNFGKFVILDFVRIRWCKINNHPVSISNEVHIMPLGHFNVLCCFIKQSKKAKINK